MLVQEVTTELARAEVLRLAREFFTTRFNAYGAFVEAASDGHIAFRTDSGELVIGTATRDGRTLVRGSSSRLHHELSQFLATLAPTDAIRQNTLGPGTSGAG